MCCATGNQQGFQKWGHQGVCFCGCDGPPYSRPRLLTQKQKIANLQTHLKDLREEARAVEEHIAQMKKEN